MTDQEYIYKLEKEISLLKESRSWKITKPLRFFGSLCRRIKVLSWIKNLFVSVKRYGVLKTFFKVEKKIGLKFFYISAHDYDYKVFFKKLAKKHKDFCKKYSNAIYQIYNLKDCENILEKCFSPQKGRYKFSILVPLYNTDSQMLKDMIESVLVQSYSNFQLCLVDSSDNEHGYVKDICMSYANQDNRIYYKSLGINQGISANSNVCIEMSDGDFISLFDHADFLHPLALEKTYEEIIKGADFIYTDEGKFKVFLGDFIEFNFKPDFSPNYLLSVNYICHFVTFKKSLLDVSGGGFNSKYDGAQDHDLVLRLTDKASKISHISEVLYFWRVHAASTAGGSNQKSYASINGCNAVYDFLLGKGIQTVVNSYDFCSTMYKVKYPILGSPLVSIIIPNKDHIDDLDKCIKSIITKSTYSNYEIIICENNSELIKTFDYYKTIENNSRIKLVVWKDSFNYSAINNYAVNFAKGDYYLLLNNDTEVIEPNWIEELLMYAQQTNVGAVGAKLLYPDDTVQHGGVVLGIGGVAGHAFLNTARNDPGYAGRASVVNEVSCVTAACIMIRKDVWNQVGGLDEGYAVAFNDVDLCMKIGSAGFSIIYNPACLLYHFESKSRGYEDTPEKQKRFSTEVFRFKEKWVKELDNGDRFFNKNFRLDASPYILNDSYFIYKKN